ncbi:MAG: tetratricopeptide repeat protein [Gemmatimonadota bacterium]
MTDISKLKRRAADLESGKDIDGAIVAYREIVELFENGEADPIDVPLYNRLGDLLLKAGETTDAVAMWERAVDHYAEGGFYNPAIALCNKILRHSPGRTIVYYKLGRILAANGFRVEARLNFIEYANRTQQQGDLTEAFRALKEFADLVPE